MRIEPALRRGRCEVLKDGGLCDGYTPVCQGAYANASNPEQCRAELAEAPQERVLPRIHKHLALPNIDDPTES